MLSVIKSEDRYHADHGWLDTRWHFSFGDYYDPENVHWSALRVFNDDVVQAKTGFDLHPHKDMEIVTFVIDGELSHQDSVGNKGVIRPGEVQVMSAGTGLLHSEKNDSDRPVHLLQLWLMPRHKGNVPRWEQKQFTAAERSGKLLPVVSSIDGKGDGTLKIDQDATIYVSSLNAGARVSHTQAAGRHAYLFVISGGVTVNGRAMAQGDQARIADEVKLVIAATSDAELMLLDLP
jgi:redox-sensitive bicupin YhaK (pirin superfamily)